MSHDLADLVRRVSAAGGSLSSASVVDPPDREEPPVGVEVLDDPAEVLAAPLVVQGFIDGIQAAVTLRYVMHRPVTLQYAAAACVHDGVISAIDERLVITHAVADAEWVGEICGTIPTWACDEVDPHEVAKASVEHLRRLRERTERSVVADVAGRGLVVVDGSIVGRMVSENVVGVVKTTRRRYLPDEVQLWSLQAGWRSSRFVIPAGDGAAKERYSCYVRLFDASARPWEFALVRLEAQDPELLEPLAALCLAQRQGSGRDARWDRHLAGVRAVEDVLRARRPELM
jgi:hypothetical protein